MDLAVLVETVKTTVMPTGVASNLLTRVDQRSLGEARSQKTLMELGIPACRALCVLTKLTNELLWRGMQLLSGGGRMHGLRRTTAKS